jgi:hypothetical protein
MVDLKALVSIGAFSCWELALSVAMNDAIVAAALVRVESKVGAPFSLGA